MVGFHKYFFEYSLSIPPPPSSTLPSLETTSCSCRRTSSRGVHPLFFPPREPPLFPPPLFSLALGSPPAQPPAFQPPFLQPPISKSPYLLPEFTPRPSPPHPSSLSITIFVFDSSLAPSTFQINILVKYNNKR
ncbi:hypothetical protein QL285_029349 [Trifolium repens]|nr:hypothetical protein QL285_029349 [Trifolium repens]